MIFHFYAQVISATPTERGTDHVIEIDSINQLTRVADVEALIIRSHPNTIDKKNKNYSGQNPCYLSAELCEKIRLMGYKHLLIDLPSVDREEDAGALAAHKSFWNYNVEPALDMTITELIYVPDEVEDGIYFLNIGISSLMTDASPSKPVIYKMTKR